MCFSKPSIPDTAAQAREDEDAREAAISAGTDTVNQNFAKFTPSYYGGIADAFRKNYQPQVDQQARDARRATTFRFANNPNSSAANRVAGQLEGDYATQSANVGSGALDAENTAKTSVEGERGQLLNLVNAGSGLSNVAEQSSNFASGFNPPASYSPLSDAFAKYTGALSGAATAQQAGYAPNPFFQKQVDFLRGSPAGSSRTIGGG